jgi:hypothetical protein
MQKKVININLSLVDEIKSFRSEIQNASSNFDKLIADGQQVLQNALSPKLGKNLSSNVKKLQAILSEIEAYQKIATKQRDEALRLSQSSKRIYQKYTEGLSISEQLGIDTRELRGYSSLFKEAQQFDKKYSQVLTKIIGDLAELS